MRSSPSSTTKPNDGPVVLSEVALADTVVIRMERFRNIADELEWRVTIEGVTVTADGETVRHYAKDYVMEPPPTVGAVTNNVFDLLTPQAKTAIVTHVTNITDTLAAELGVAPE